MNKIWISLPNITSINNICEDYIKILKQDKIIGIILFADNIDKIIEPSLNKFLKLQSLIKSIKLINKNLLFSIDHEGGLIYRFDFIFRPPAAKFFGNIYKYKSKAQAKYMCEKAAYLVGQDLKKLVIDICFSPVCDVHYDKSQIIGAKLRAFSDDPNAICDLSISWILGLNKAGIMGCLKHFPGHGRCELDSHIDFPIDNRSKKLWKADLEIYKNIFNKLEKYKINNKIGVMLGHMRVPGLEIKKSNLYDSPIYSSFIIKELLIKDLGFTGYIISDCLSMRASGRASDKSPDKSPDKLLDKSQDKSCEKISGKISGKKSELINNKFRLINKISKAHDAGCDWVIASGFDLKILQQEIFSAN